MNCYSELFFADEIVVMQSSLSNDAIGDKYVYLTTESGISNLRHVDDISKAFRYTITDKDFEFKLKYDPIQDIGRIQLLVKNKSFKSNDWYIVGNWSFIDNPDLLMSNNHGVVENPGNFEIAFRRDGHCAFIEKGTKIHEIIQLNSTDKDIFELSKKTSKRKPGYSYITKDSRLIYLCELWKLTADKITDTLKKEKVRAYTVKPLGDTTKSSITNALLNPDTFTFYEFSDKEERVRCYY